MYLIIELFAVILLFQKIKACFDSEKLILTYSNASLPYF